MSEFEILETEAQRGLDRTLENKGFVKDILLFDGASVSGVSYARFRNDESGEFALVMYKNIAIRDVILFKTRDALNQYLVTNILAATRSRG